MKISVVIGFPSLEFFGEQIVDVGSHRQFRNLIAFVHGVSGLCRKQCIDFTLMMRVTFRCDRLLEERGGEEEEMCICHVNQECKTQRVLLCLITYSLPQVNNAFRFFA